MVAERRTQASTVMSQENRQSAKTKRKSVVKLRAQIEYTSTARMVLGVLNGVGSGD